jgi:chromosomal replication initiation ATPase DnaA
MTSDNYIAATAYIFGVNRADIMGRNRCAKVAEARMALAWLLRQSDWSLEAIGALLSRDHTTIRYAVATIDRRMEKNTRLAGRL